MSEKELKIREEELALKAKEIENEREKQAQDVSKPGGYDCKHVQTTRSDTKTSDSFFAAGNGSNKHKL